jgi:hypothetical protein
MSKVLESNDGFYSPKLHLHLRIEIFSTPQLMIQMDHCVLRLRNGCILSA